MWFYWPFVTHVIVLDVGEYGSNNDSGILKGSKIDKLFDKNKMDISESKMILGDDLELSLRQGIPSKKLANETAF